MGLTYPDFVQIGLPDDIELVVHSGWQSRRSGSGAFEPVGFMLHHTAGTNSLKLLLDKSLVQWYVDQRARAHLLSNGRTGHPGKGSSTVLNEVRRGIAPSGTAAERRLEDDTYGYAYFVGVEIENLGRDDTPYAEGQLRTACYLAAVECVMRGWTANHVIEHDEWTRRKIDLRPATTRAFGIGPRDLVASYIDEIERRINPLAQLEAPPAEGPDGNRPPAAPPDLTDLARRMAEYGWYRPPANGEQALIVLEQAVRQAQQHYGLPITGVPTREFDAVLGPKPKPKSPAIITGPAEKPMPTPEDQQEARDQAPPPVATGLVNEEPVGVAFIVSAVTVVGGYLLGSEVFDSEVADLLTAAVSAAVTLLSAVVARAKVTSPATMSKLARVTAAERAP